MTVSEQHPPDDDGHPLDWYPEPITDAERQAWEAGEPFYPSEAIRAAIEGGVDPDA